MLNPLLIKTFTAGGAIGGQINTIVEEYNSIRVANLGPDGIHLRYGNGAQTAGISDIFIPAGAIEIFGAGKTDTHVSVLVESGTGKSATVKIIPGWGM